MFFLSLSPPRSTAPAARWPADWGHGGGALLPSPQLPLWRPPPPHAASRAPAHFRSATRLPACRPPAGWPAWSRRRRRRENWLKPPWRRRRRGGWKAPVWPRPPARAGSQAAHPAADSSCAPLPPPPSAGTACAARRAGCQEMATAAPPAAATPRRRHPPPARHHHSAPTRPPPQSPPARLHRSRVPPGRSRGTRRGAGRPGTE